MIENNDIEQYLAKLELVRPSAQTDNIICAYSKTKIKELKATQEPHWLELLETSLRVLGFDWIIAIRWLLMPKENELIRVTFI
jgi:hypothetical protein